MKYTRICKLCGQSFITNNARKSYCDNQHFGICEVCGTRFEINNVHYPDRTCSIGCRKALRKQNAEKTSLERYGVKNAGGTAESLAKINATCRKKYGVDWTGQSEIQKQHVLETFEKNGGNPMQRSECQQKAKDTCQKKYGANNPLSKESSIREYAYQKAEEKYGTRNPGNLPEFREKAKQTSLEHYGAEYFFQTKEGDEAKKAGMLKKFGVERPMQSPEIVAKMRANNVAKYGVGCTLSSPDNAHKAIETNLKKYGVPYYCMHEKCIAAQGSQPSKLGQALGNKISDVSGKEVEFEFKIGKSRFDIHIEGTSTLIELDPTYTHSTVDVEKYGKIKASYHQDKSRIAEEAGFRCVHIFDWDNQDKVVRMFLPKQKIFARKCKISSVSQLDTDKFLNDYHLQGTCKSQEYRYGLYYDNELVEVMTFGKPRYNNKFEWELLRLCTSTGVEVIGGASKLFKKFIDEVNPESIVSYCDKAKFTGDIYYRLGFSLGDPGTPSKHWSKYKQHVTDNLLRQRGYDQLFGTSYGKGTSNEELMLENKWLPVYDCGQARFEWRTA